MSAKVGEFAPYIVPLLIMAVIARRSGQARKLRLGRMWVRPALFGLIALAALAAAPSPSLVVALAFVAVAVAGAGAGFLRARHLHLTVDPDTGELSSRATWVGTALILGLFALRFGLKLVFPEMEHPGHGGGAVTQAANGLLIFTVTMLAAQTYFIHARARPLLAAHAARSAGE